MLYTTNEKQLVDVKRAQEELHALSGYANVVEKADIYAVASAMNGDAFDYGRKIGIVNAFLVLLDMYRRACHKIAVLEAQRHVSPMPDKYSPR